MPQERREEARIARCPTTISILEVPTQCHRLGKGSSVAKWEGWGQRDGAAATMLKAEPKRPSPKLEERLVEDSQLLHIEA